MPERAQPTDDTEHRARGRYQRADIERKDVLGRDNAHCIEDEPVLFEREEKHVVAPDLLDRPLQRFGGQHRRTLLGELDEEDLPNRRPGLGAAERAPVQGEEKTGRYADPSIHGSEKRDSHRAHAPFLLSTYTEFSRGGLRRAAASQ
jgi:hypothetical protein